MKPVRAPFVGTRPGLASFEAITDAEEDRESNRRWRHPWFMWAMITTGLALLFLLLFIVFAVLYANQYPQCSLKNMHFTSAVSKTESTFPILQSGSAFYRNAGYGHKLTACETWLMRDLEKLPGHITGPLNGVQSNT